MDQNKFYCFNRLATSSSNEFIHVDKKKDVLQARSKLDLLQVDLLDQNLKTVDK